MAVIYNATLRTNRLSVVNDAISGKTFAGGTGTAVKGKLLIYDVDTLLVTIELATTAGSVSGDVLTLDASGAPSGIAVATGSATRAEIRNNGNVVVISGLTVGISGADIIVNSAAIAVNQTITLVSGAITHPST